MEKIASFQINHERLLPGLYVSRLDKSGEEFVTTFDIRITRPIFDDVMDTASIHAIEHLGATYLRSSAIKDKVLYFGPMGCRTGFYLLIFGNLTPSDILPYIKDTFLYILNFEGKIPGQSAIECGNYKDLSLEGAKRYAKKYLDEFLLNSPIDRMIYPN